MRPWVVRRCGGIELIPELHEVAQRVRVTYETSDLCPGSPGRECLLLCGDALECREWHDACLVFVNCVTWPEEVLKQLGEVATRHMRPGAVLALVKRKLDDKLAAQYWSWRWSLCEMSFGECRVHIFTRNATPCP